MQDLIIKLVRKPSFSIYKPPEQQSVIPRELLFIKIENEICPHCYGESEVLFSRIALYKLNLHVKFTRNGFKAIFQEFRKLVQLLKRKIGILEEHQLQLVSQKGSDFLVLLFTALEASRNIN